MTILTLALAITGAFGEGVTRGSASTPKDKGTLKKLVDRLANALKKLGGKAVDAIPAIIGSDIGAILSFLSKAVGFVTKILGP